MNKYIQNLQSISPRSHNKLTCMYRVSLPHHKKRRPNLRTINHYVSQQKPRSSESPYE